jgi:hypothetical protein
MKWLMALLFAATWVADADAKDNGRRPCDRGAGGVSHCLGDKFICNNGKVSGSKQTCTPAEHGAKPKPREQEKPRGSR